MDNIEIDREHVDSMECWCHPDLILEGVKDRFGSVMVHKAPGEELAPAFIIAAAIAEAFVTHDP